MVTLVEQTADVKPHKCPHGDYTSSTHKGPIVSQNPTCSEQLWEQRPVFSNFLLPLFFYIYFLPCWVPFWVPIKDFRFDGIHYLGFQVNQHSCTALDGSWGFFVVVVCLFVL